VHAVAAASGAPVMTRLRDGPEGLERLEGAPPLWVARLPSPAAPVFRDTWSVPAFEAALATVLARERPQVVHIHHLAHLGLGCVRAAKAAGAAVVFTLHDYHLLCIRGQLVDRDLRRCPGPGDERCAACVAEHLRATPGLHRLGAVADRLGLRAAARQAVAAPRPGPALVARAGERIRAAATALAAADRVLSPSADLARRVQALGWRSQIAVQDLPLVAPVPPAPPPPPGPVRFLYVGSLIPTKGADVLVEAFSRLPAGELAVWGPAVDFDGHPGWARALIALLEATPRARWRGTFGDGQRAAVYWEADVLVVPSIWEENSPLVVREATAAGLRVVCSDVGGVAEIAPDARRVPPGDPEALAEALLDELRAGRGRAAPRAWPLDAHLEDLQRHYRAALSGVD
jgi:glycosyltransferase involved in cell wall biosynthesis